METVTGSISTQLPTVLLIKQMPDVATLVGVAKDVVAAALVQYESVPEPVLPAVTAAAVKSTVPEHIA